MNRNSKRRPGRRKSGPAIGIDIGGTKISAGLVDARGRILRRARYETPDRSQRPQVVEDLIVAAINELRAEQEPSAVGIGAAGFIDHTRATVLFSPHLSWRNEPLQRAIRQRVGLPVIVENDANTALCAEVKFGAGQGVRQALTVNVGTGIGGAILLDGRLYRGEYGLAGEFGHLQLCPGGRPCECGNFGCWEQYASGNALVRQARQLLKTSPAQVTTLREQLGAQGTPLTGPQITAAAQAGDAAAVALFADIGHWLGVGLANLATAFDPAMMIIGGGVSAAQELLLDPARRSFEAHLPGRGFRPSAQIVAGALGNDAGLVGAADLARRAARRHQRWRTSA